MQEAPKDVPREALVARLDQALEQFHRSAWPFGRELQRLRDSGVIVVKVGNPARSVGRPHFTLTDLASRYDMTKSTLSRLLRICDLVPSGQEMGASFTAWDEAFRAAKDDEAAFDLMDRLGGQASRKRIRELLEMDKAQAEELIADAHERSAKFKAEHEEQTLQEQAKREHEEREIDERIMAWDESLPDSSDYEHLRMLLREFRSHLEQIITTTSEAKLTAEQMAEVGREMDTAQGEIAAFLALLSEFTH